MANTPIFCENIFENEIDHNEKIIFVHFRTEARKIKAENLWKSIFRYMAKHGDVRFNSNSYLR